jgi:hypothetical protein
MTTTLVGFANLFVVSLVVGAMFGIWLGYNPMDLSQIAYLEQQQQAIRTLNVTMPLLGAIGTVLTVASAVLARDGRLAFVLLTAAVGVCSSRVSSRASAISQSMRGSGRGACKRCRLTGRPSGTTGGDGTFGGRLPVSSV